MEGLGPQPRQRLGAPNALASTRIPSRVLWNDRETPPLLFGRKNAGIESRFDLVEGDLQLAAKQRLSYFPNT